MTVAIKACQHTRLPASRRRCMLPICVDPGRNHRCTNGRRRSFTPSPGVPDSAAQHGGNPIELPWRRPVWSANSTRASALRACSASGYRRIEGSQWPGGVARRLTDPVSADSRTWHDRNNRLEHSAARLDHFFRSDVALVARDEHIGQAELARDDKALPQDLGGASASAIGRQDTEPDVPADLSELFGESVSDRRATDYSSACFCDEESRRNPSGRQANPGALLLNGCAISVPIRLGRQPGSKAKSSDSLGQSAHSAAKGGVIALTRTLAAESLRLRP